MADLITLETLAKWTQNDLATLQADPLAAEVTEKVSDLVRFIGGHPEWELGDPDDAPPFDVQMVVLKVAKRTYQNPDQVLQEGSVGPIGGDRYLDETALLFDLTEGERATVAKYNPTGDPDAEAAQLWVLRTTRGGVDLVDEPILYARDNQQVNFTEDDSAWPPWDIPMFSPGDPGDPNLYVEG